MAKKEKKEDKKNYEANKQTGGVLVCPGRISNSCSASGIRLLNHTNIIWYVNRVEHQFA